MPYMWGENTKGRICKGVKLTRETIITCDRCKAHGGLMMESHYHQFIDKKNDDEPRDLCSDCYDAFVAWWEKGKE